MPYPFVISSAGSKSLDTRYLNWNCCSFCKILFSTSPMALQYRTNGKARGLTPCYRHQKSRAIAFIVYHNICTSNNRCIVGFFSDVHFFNAKAFLHLCELLKCILVTQIITLVSCALLLKPASGRTAHFANNPKLPHFALWPKCCLVRAAC